MGAFGLASLGVVGVLAGLLKREPSWIRSGMLVIGLALSGYGLAWGAGFAGGKSKVLPIGAEVGFCDVDCDLHVSVVRVAREGDLAVTVRFRSDAREATGHPSQLRLAVVDAQGRRYLPSSSPIAEPLGPGAVVERAVRFGVPVSAGSPRLEVSYDGLLDYLVPGPGNAWVQRRTLLALGEPDNR